MGYKTQSEDTKRDVEERQTAYFRRLGCNGRLLAGAQMMDEGFNAFLASLKRRNPAWTAEQLRVEWVRANYGEELAQRYAAHLQCKTPNTTDSASP